MMPYFMYGSASYILTAKNIATLKLNGAFKGLHALFISAIKKTLQLPSKGSIRPIEELFEFISPIHLIAKNYLRCHVKWK